MERAGSFKASLGGCVDTVERNIHAMLMPDFDILAAHGVPHRLLAVGHFLVQTDFLGDPRDLAAFADFFRALTDCFSA
jgi:hypothetical protein